MKARVTLLLLLAPALVHASEALADRVLVDKSEHRMTVYAKDRVLASFPVGLGFVPQGPKQRQGDGRTPEGKYVLDRKNAHSDYFRAIHISYPNDADRAAARRGGYPTGGDILVHGQPNDPRLAQAVARSPSPDWTNGCISLSNADMQRLWELVTPPVPIEIVP